MLLNYTGQGMAQLACAIALLFGTWNFLEAKRWRGEFLARPFSNFELGKFRTSQWLSLHNHKRANGGWPDKPILIYFLSPNDCGQCLNELQQLIPTISQLALKVSIVLIGATQDEAAQVNAEWSQLVGEKPDIELLSCNHCSKNDFGLIATPYRVLVNLSQGFILEEGPVQFSTGSSSRLAETLASRLASMNHGNP